MRKETIDIYKPRRRYYSDECGLDSCPECGAILVEEVCTIVLCVKSSTDKGEFMTNYNGSHFCKKCPVVVFESEKLQFATKYGIRGSKNLKYIIAGIVDTDSIPEDKQHLEMGTDENPVLLVNFLPDLANGITDTIISEKIPGRNDPCICGSGLKYKKCCGKYNSNEKGD